MDIENIRWGGMDWIVLVQDRDKWRALANVDKELSGSIKCRETIE
jgi:hypothetical protein